VITFESVTKKYADGAIAVDDLSIEFASGRHSGLAYRTPAEVAQTWEDGRNQLNHAA
jgi:hypothetical protein